jgi:ABC-type phosphate transport system auxiliary subunit
MEAAQILQLSDAINLGVAGLFLILCIYAIRYLFNQVTIQNEDTKKYLIHQLEVQEQQCAEENRIVREQVREIKDELRAYKTEDKRLILDFVNTLSKDNQNINSALSNVAKSLEHLTTELKKH